MADWCRPPSPLLPAFGIRALNGPDAPPGVVQLTGRQYNSTITSQPDATLRYFDDDDGDLITVGSSFELEQRLHEHVKPPPSFVPISPYNENKMMHIFDIQKSAGSLAVWRDHEAYSSKSLRKETTNCQMSADDALAGPFSSERPSAPVSAPEQPILTNDLPKAQQGRPSAPDNEQSRPARPVLAHEEIAAQLDKAFAGVFESIQFQLGPLADFLETTAGGLRKAAEKTAEADTTAVEDVLTGFKGIWTELGEMGREFLVSIDEELKKKQPSEDTTKDVEQKAPSLPNPTVKEGEVPSKSEGVSKRVSFMQTPPRPVPKTTQPKVIERPTAKAFGPSFGFNAYAQKPMLSQPVIAKPNPKQLGHPDSAKNSILDWETSDPDFSTRYPPLLSLRKAKSVSGIHDKALPDPPLRDGTQGNSALSRYPSIGQFEEQTRLKAKFPPPPMKLSSAGSSTTAPKKDSDHEPPVESAAETSMPASGNKLSKTHHENDQPRNNSSWVPASLPGAWPEAKFEDWYCAHSPSRHPPTTALPAGRTSLPASFPYGVLPSNKPASETLSHRVSSPVSETYSRAPIFPRRFQTVSGTNPAARLNGPFDPLANFPALQPRPQRSQPDLKHPRQSSDDKPANGTPPLPGAFPQRSRTVHHTDRYKPQPFSQPKSTLWDNYVKSSSDVSRPPFPTLDESKRQPLPTPVDRVYQQIHSLPTPRNEQRPALPRRSEPELPTPTRITRHPEMQFPASGASAQPEYSEPGPYNFTWRTDPGFETFAPSTTKPQSNVVPPSIQPPSVDLAFRPLFQSPTETQGDNPIFRPFVSNPGPTIVTVPTSRLSHSPASPVEQTPSAVTAVEDCVRMLKSMGYGSDANELARLTVYAGAAAGNLEDAIEMIEEDREAAKELHEGKDLQEIRDLDS